MTMRAPLPLVVNPSAGGLGDPTGRLRGKLEAAGVAVDLLTDDLSFERALRAVVEEGAAIVGVAGGDGSMRKAASVLAQSDVALAVFPTGTLNHFSRSLGIDSIDAAVAAVAHGQVERIAVGFVDDEPFLNTATFGLYADVVRRRDRLRRWLGKWPAALIAFNATIARYHPLRVTVDVDGRALERVTGLVSAGVSRRSFPVRDVPMRLEREPELVLSILRAHNRSGLLGTATRTAWRLAARKADDDRDAEVLRTSAFALASRSHRLGITLDGDVVGSANEVRVGLRMDALRVVVPAAAYRASATTRGES